MICKIPVNKQYEVFASTNSSLLEQDDRVAVAKYELESGAIAINKQRTLSHY